MTEETLPTELKTILSESADGANLVPWVDQQGMLSDVKNRVSSGYNLDLVSMDKYLKKHPKVLKLSQMNWDDGDKTFPFVGASNVMMPYLAQSGIDFWSRTLPDIVNQRNIAKCATYGKPSVEKEDRASRVASAINYQLRVGIDGWREGMSYALNYNAIIGMYFKKKWYEDGEIKDYLITADKLIYDHDAVSFDSAPRKSHLFPLSRNDYNSKVVSGEFEPISLPDNVNTDVDEDLRFIESHCTLDLDGDGYAEPYIVTWWEDDDTIVRIVPRFDEEDVLTIDGDVYKISGENFFTQTGFLNDLEKPAIFIGWGWLLYDLYETLNTMMRQLLDAGTLGNLASNTGFISSNSSIARKARGGQYEMILGKLTKIDAGGTQGKLSDQVFTMPFNGPSTGMYQLLENLKEEVRAYTTLSQNIDANQGEAASLYLARLQQALKVPNAIMTQCYFGQSAEFQRIYDLIDRYMPNEEYIEILDWEPEIPEEAQKAFERAQQAAGQAGQLPPLPPESIAWEQVSKEGDFEEGFDVQPTADPSMGSDQERAARAEAIAQRAQAMPQLYNVYEAEKNWLESIGTSEIDSILPQPNNQPSQSDMTNQAYMEAEIGRINAEKELKIATVKEKAMKAARDQATLESDIDNTESSTIKNLSEADKTIAEQNMSLIDKESSTTVESEDAREYGVNPTNNTGAA